MEPGALNLPGVQLAQLETEVAPNCVEARPASHCWHVATPSSMLPYHPNVHCEHAELEVAPVNKTVAPTGHVPVHSVVPVCEENVATPHGSHGVAGLTSLSCMPAEQSTHAGTGGTPKFTCCSCLTTSATCASVSAEACSSR